MSRGIVSYTEEEEKMQYNKDVTNSSLTFTTLKNSCVDAKGNTESQYPMSLTLSKPQQQFDTAGPTNPWIKKNLQQALLSSYVSKILI